MNNLLNKEDRNEYDRKNKNLLINTDDRNNKDKENDFIKIINLLLLDLDSFIDS